MNIVYLVPHVPNPTKVRSHFQIRGLVEAGHQVTVATLIRSAKDVEYANNLKGTGCSVIAVRLARTQAVINSFMAVARGLPLQARFMWSSALIRDIKRSLRANRPDIIHVEHLRMSQYG